jgi:hypothetical protein
MDTSARISALQLAKTIIASHGLTAHMNKYSRDVLARSIDPSSTGIRYDFHLDPERTAWSTQNPSCSLSVAYSHDQNSTRVDEQGNSVIDNDLRIGVSADTSNMDLRTFRQRESMMSMLSMLCELLESTLPQKITLVVSTAAEIAEKKQRGFEQTIGHAIVANIGVSNLKGLRAGGNPRTYRLSESYLSLDGKYPAAGTYRYDLVRSYARNGSPKEVVHYVIRVIGSEGTLVTIRREEDRKK